MTGLTRHQRILIAKDAICTGMAIADTFPDDIGKFSEGLDLIEEGIDIFRALWNDLADYEQAIR